MIIPSRTYQHCPHSHRGGSTYQIAGTVDLAFQPCRGVRGERTTLRALAPQAWWAPHGQKSDEHDHHHVGPATTGRTEVL